MKISCLIHFLQGITLSYAVLSAVFNPFQSLHAQRGPPDSPFAGGEYYGVLLFPAEYPFKPPGIKVALAFFPLHAFPIEFSRRCSHPPAVFSPIRRFASQCRIFIQEL